MQEESVKNRRKDFRHCRLVEVRYVDKVKVAEEARCDNRAPPSGGCVCCDKLRMLHTLEI